MTLRRGTKVLLDGAEFVVHPGERVGIVGKNGAGKSSLFALLTGTLDLDAGNLAMPAGWRIASVKQEIEADERPAREFVIDGDTHLRELQARRAELTDEQGTQIAEVEAALVEAGAWSAASRAEQLLAGLGFKPAEWMQPVASFSGGWRMRLALARALMAPSELLLLDEPTNHLDLDAMLWLEKWLAAYPGTVMLISHDTEFLDAVAKSILHFDHAKLVRYRGGYGDFLTQRAERLRQTNIAYERQTREAARLQGFIDRFKAKASKAKQAQSRVKALARMQVLAPLHAEAGIDIRIPSPDQVPDPLLTLEHLSAGYTDADGNAVPILRDVTLMVRAGSRVGVLGANGAGKSTLIKTLAEELPVQAGTRRASRGLAIGYFHQHQLDMLDVDSTPIAHLARLAPETREQELHNYLGGFGFSGDTVTSKVGPMSGGEKARLALSLIVWQKPNLLLLDEPSNHLDVETREALAAALADFGGSMLLVSHDRHLLRTTVDSFWIVADGAVREFDGDLEDYRDWL
ncbi:ABC-F family ATP-binding cassette domain-containing protein, partial [Achromobacter aegrifaciens]|uniref:ABC-F family ATP-binding cassette domain-containing protein n=1 Tax=Achromobacter aegrifaciens TaxID=1287736 RepID=UPI0035E44E69